MNNKIQNKTDYKIQCTIICIISSMKQTCEMSALFRPDGLRVPGNNDNNNKLYLPKSTKKHSQCNTQIIGVMARQPVNRKDILYFQVGHTHKHRHTKI